MGPQQKLRHVPRGRPVSAISPQDWQDQEDGRALRELREAAGAGYFFHVVDQDGEFRLNVAAFRADPLRDYQLRAYSSTKGATIAAAADACRAALRERAG